MSAYAVLLLPFVTLSAAALCPGGAFGTQRAYNSGSPRNRQEKADVKPPKEIKNIVGKTYTVRPDPSLGDDDNDGKCRPRKQLITYDPGPALGQLRDTIWHEIKHGIWAEMGLNETINNERVTGDDIEEEVILRLATAELAVLRSNKKLRDFLFEDAEN